MAMNEWLGSILLVGSMCVYFVESADSIRSARIFSKRPNEYRVIRRYYDISIAACEIQCMYRNSCRAVIYVRKAYICKLLWRYSASEVIEAKRNLYEAELDDHHQDFSPCLGVSCADKQTCAPTDSGNICKYTECGRPPDIFHVINGNMFSLGNTVIVSVGSQNVNTGLVASKITCGDDGVWHPVDSQCLPGWKKFGNACYWLDATLRTQPSAETYCENMVHNAYLADIKTAAEIMQLTDWLQQSGVEGVWINGKYNAVDGLYYWADGTAVSSIGWGRLETNNDDEHCMACWRDHGYRWVDITCDYTLKSLCKQDIYIGA